MSHSPQPTFASTLVRHTFCAVVVFLIFRFFGVSPSWAATPSKQPSPSQKTSLSKPTIRSVNAATQPKVLSPSKKADPFVRGVQLSQRAEWGRALKSFDIAKQKMLFKLKKQQRALLFLYMGLSYIHLLQQQRGTNAFEKALLLDACIKLPAKLDLSPQIRALFQKSQRPYLAVCRRQKTVPARRILPPKPPPRPPQRPPWKPKVPEPSRSIRVSAWSVLGVGVLTLGTAFVFGGLALWNEVDRNRQKFDAEGTKKYLELDQSARDRAAFANIMFGASGVLLFTGFALHISQWIQPLVKPKPQQPIKTKKQLLLRESL